MVQSYSYLQKVSNSTKEVESLNKKLVESKKENAKLKETLTRQDKELLLSARLMSEVQYKAFEASMARDRAESQLAKLSDELNNLKAEHAQL